MGVYIKGMDMPRSCRQCSLYLQSMDSERNVYENCAFTAKSYNCGLTTRPSDCPLVPVPPHGRLIDADALLMRINHEVMEAYMDGACYGVHPSQEYLYLLGEIIDDAPTVIPAEEGKA